MLQSRTMRVCIETMVREIQDVISEAVERMDGCRLRQDTWTRPEGGGGISRILQDGNVFEKAGVNISTVMGTLASEAARALKLGGQETRETPLTFYATGVSVVIHPHNPMAPTVHANYRYFEIDDGRAQGSWWFGGGSDLTPAYLIESDAVHFHRMLKTACDQHDPTFYPRFKQTCDDYFYLPHRGERRGVGGIFFDHLNERNPEFYLAFVTDCARAFVPSYFPLIEKRKDMSFTAEQKAWQQLRRGRYVEFNLIHDRGTTFGIRTGGRIESILMSLPRTAAWAYDHQPVVGSPEAMTIEVLKNPRTWV
ncbi:MAG TPA: oxygen-dependent coproporphyrinogen oxidase [Ktedonobacteraceae bacterium]|nr:oxygen-dependent coproporphyrinogen oxidase [Ktedonobacteraceae bacterium]